MVVAVGVTEREPPARGVTDPTPRSIVNEVVLVVVHARLEAVPSTIVLGDAVRVQVGAGWSVTATVSAQVLVNPFAPVTVPVYVVVTLGETEREPPTTGVTEPIPWLREMDVALVVVHASEEAAPLSMDAGDAVRVQLGTGTAVTVTVAVHGVEPPGPVAVPL